MRPPLGASAPLIRLTKVLLPAPLGPMTPSDSPERTSRSTPSTAATPPKRRLKVSTRSAARFSHCALPRLQAPRPAAGDQAPDALRRQPDDQQQEQSGDGVVQFGQIAQQLAQRDVDQRAQQRPAARGDAADDDHGDGVDGPRHAEGAIRLDRAELECLQAADDADEEGRQRKGTELHAKAAHAHLPRHVLVVTHRAQRQRCGRVQHRDDDAAGEQRHHQREPVQRIETRRRCLEHDAGCAAEGAEVHHQDAQGLGQREAADGEIQPAQAEQRRDSRARRTARRRRRQASSSSGSGAPVRCPAARRRRRRGRRRRRCRATPARRSRRADSRPSPA